MCESVNMKKRLDYMKSMVILPVFSQFLSMKQYFLGKPINAFTVAFPPLDNVQYSMLASGWHLQGQFAKFAQRIGQLHGPLVLTSPIEIAENRVIQNLPLLPHVLLPVVCQHFQMFRQLFDIFEVIGCNE